MFSFWLNYNIHYLIGTHFHLVQVCLEKYFKIFKIHFSSREVDTCLLVCKRFFM